jgi:RimJ/RimL family protein N-acetyltransferase
MYSISMDEARCGGACPGKFVPVLKTLGKCSCFRAKPAHFSAVAHFGGLLPVCYEVVYSSRDRMPLDCRQKPAHNGESKRGESNMESTPDTTSIVLRDVMMSDLPIFFDQQLDPEANRMAAFTRKDPADRDAFMAHWAKILRDETITIQTILFDGQVAGSVLSYVDEDGQLEVSYWIGRPYWGKGVATRGLLAFLDHIKVRPLYARVAQDNIGSLRVLEKCRFTRIGEGRGFSEARGQEVEEFLLRLD